MKDAHESAMAFIAKEEKIPQLRSHFTSSSIVSDQNTFTRIIDVQEHHLESEGYRMLIYSCMFSQKGQCVQKAAASCRRVSVIYDDMESVPVNHLQNLHWIFLFGHSSSFWLRRVYHHFMDHLFDSNYNTFCSIVEMLPLGICLVIDNTVPSHPRVFWYQSQSMILPEFSCVSTDLYQRRLHHLRSTLHAHGILSDLTDIISHYANTKQLLLSAALEDPRKNWSGISMDIDFNALKNNT